jgi:uncharacterized protein (UPF0210 family)
MTPDNTGCEKCIQGRACWHNDTPSVTEEQMAEEIRSTSRSRETADQMAARLGVPVREIRIAVLGWKLKQQKPDTPDAICMAGARWIYPYLVGEK